MIRHANRARGISIRACGGKSEQLWTYSSCGQLYSGRGFKATCCTSCRTDTALCIPSPATSWPEKAQLSAELQDLTGAHLTFNTCNDVELPGSHDYPKHTSFLDWMTTMATGPVPSSDFHDAPPCMDPASLHSCYIRYILFDKELRGHTFRRHLLVATTCDARRCSGQNMDTMMHSSPAVASFVCPGQVQCWGSLTESYAPSEF